MTITNNPCGCSTSPSSISYCDLGATTASTFRIRRHDNCPRLEVDVEANGSPVDLTDWAAEATLFWMTSLADALDDDATTIPLADVSNVRVTDAGRIEETDAPREAVAITAVNRDASIVTVTRTNPAAHAAGTRFVGIRADAIPVDIVMEYSELDPEEAAIRVGGGNTDPVLMRTILRVMWRTTDTVQSGTLLVQIRLEGPDGEKMTLPRSSAGYEVIIVGDADDV